MQNIRRRELDAASMFRFQLAADARMSRTNYADDQAWTVELGSRDNAALAMQTQFGGRAGLASLVPMWLIKQRQIYQHQSYHKPPIVTHFAPNFLRVEAEIVPQLSLVARYWVMESRAAGCEFVLSNVGDQQIKLQLDVFGHVTINSRSSKLNVLTLGDYSLALHLGQIGNINPVLTLEGANVDVYGGRISSPKLGCKLVLEPGARTRVPFVIAGLPDMRDSVSVAMNWMAKPWQDYFERIDRAAASVPQVYTGNDDWDTAIDLSYALLLKSFMGANEQLPQPSFVGNRASNRGWSRRGDGSDHIRSWAGQDPTLAHLAVPVLSHINSANAKGIIRNYLSIQDESGFVDRQPGLGGQRQGLLLMPLLARLSWTAFQDHNDHEFIAEVYPKLSAFIERWFQDDMDADGDGVPEWRSERQMGYVAFPTFGLGQGWAQGANLRQMETPDLLAYLISEVDALCEMAQLLGDAGHKELTERRFQLLEGLEEFWDGSRFRYRDRDSHLTSESVELLHAGAGDEIHLIERALLAANRVAIRIVGGVSQRPRITLRLAGRDENGTDCIVEAGAEEFLWQNRQGIYSTRQALSYIGSIEVSGLSRVYKVYANTIDSSRLDINHLIPLSTVRLPKERAAALVDLAMDEAHFLRPNGLTMVSASDADFDASNARGGGGIWMYWLSLIGEGMVKSGFHAEATSLIKRVLTSLCKVLEREGHLSQFYHADEVKGFGEDHHIGGIVPLQLLSDVLGIRIVSAQRVWIGGPFTWEQPIKLVQHGVTVSRNADGISIVFPSGHRETLAAEAEWQAVTDPAPLVDDSDALELLADSDAVLLSETESERRVLIDVEIDDEQGALENSAKKQDDRDEDGVVPADPTEGKPNKSNKA